MNTQVRLCLIITCLASMAAAQPLAEETETIREALQRLMAAVRSADDRQFGRFLTPVEPISPERAETLQLLRELKDRARLMSAEPMSELSPPIILVSIVSVDGPGRARACAYLVRVGSLVSLRLATYDVAAAKIGKDWRLASLATGGRCQTATEPLTP